MELYRARDCYQFLGSHRIQISIVFATYTVVRENERSYWISVQGETKRVEKTHQGARNKRFAYADKEDALKDLKIRRSREKRHLEKRLSDIEQGIEYLKTYKIGDPPTEGTTELVEYDW